MIDGSVHGIFILGTTGESISLSYQARKELIKQSAIHIDKRVPMLVGITDTSIEESLDLATLAAKNGAAAVVAAPPYYFNLGQEELYEYYLDLADRLSLPLFLCNIPSLTKMPIAVDTAIRQSEHPNIISLKDSSKNAVYFKALKHGVLDKDFSFFVDPEEIMPETVLMGSNGVLNGGANLFSKFYACMYEAAINHDILKISVMQSLVGLCNNYIAPPIRPYRKNEMKQIATRLDAILSNLSIIEL